MGGEGGEEKGVEREPSRCQPERRGGGTAKERDSLPLRSLPPHLSSSLRGTFPAPSLFSFLTPRLWLLRSRFGRLRMQELGESTRTRASSHAPSRGSREPGRHRAQWDARSRSGGRPARSGSTWVLTTKQRVREGPSCCWRYSSFPGARLGGESLPPITS